MSKEVRQKVHAASTAEEVDLDDIESVEVVVTHHAGDASSHSSNDDDSADLEDGVSPRTQSIGSPRQAVAREAKEREVDVVDCVQELRSRLGVSSSGAPPPSTKPVISVNRIGLQARIAVPAAVHQPPQQDMLPLFDNAGDDMIKFHRSDDDDDGTGTDEDVDAKTLQARRRRKIDRDFDNAAEERKAAEEEDEAAEQWNDEDDSSQNSENWESSSVSSSSNSSDDSVEESDDESPSDEVPEQQQPPKQKSTADSQTLGRSHYSGITFQSHYNRDASSRTAFGCHHTLLGLTAPQTIRGPCAIFGVFNEASCNGFLLGKKHFMVRGKDVAVLQPMQKLTSSGSQQSLAELLASRQERMTKAAAVAHPSQGGFASCAGNDAAWGVGATEAPEAKFGAIDWDWVANTLQSWLTRLAADKSMSVVLVVEKYLPGELMTRRVHFTRAASHVDRYGSGDSMLIPSCFARKNVPPPVEPALLPVFRKMMISAHSVAVVGGQNIGKSTFGRALANGFLSQQGVCYWLDLDLGRPEFGVSGSMSISRIHRPLVKENDIDAADWVKLVHVGGARMQCPETMALALDTICAYVDTHHKSWLRPLIINTHGWIQSSGRRSTVEALRRLHPQHVVQLMRHGDPKWVMPEIIFEPSCGLNRRVVADRFLQGIPSCMPEAHGRRNATEQNSSKSDSTTSVPEMQVHSLTVVRLGAVHKPADTRKDNWKRYFYPLMSANSSASCTVLDVALPTSCDAGSTAGHAPILVMPQDAHGDATVEEFVGATSHSVVALCCAPSLAPQSSSTPPQRKPQKRSRDAQTASHDRVAPVARPQDVMQSAQFLCYGFVVSSWAATSNALQIAVPFSQAQLRSIFGEALSSPTSRLVLYACPHEAFDTNFLVPSNKPKPLM